ncbi:MAG: exported protein of unknown function [Gemmatimonadetes bacterium]|nr:exported protein of unknown function [Gemmatimonadota bacterium]
MSITLVASLISAATALFVAAMTYTLSKRREREADWRKIKLEQYREFILALSGVTGRRATDVDQLRYSDSVNTLSLVAPAPVLEALYAFQDEIGARNTNKSQQAHDAALTRLLMEIRRDIHPATKADASFQFRLYDAPSPRVTGPSS